MKMELLKGKFSTERTSSEEGTLILLAIILFENSSEDDQGRFLIF